jgi:hypothetical protein
MATMTLKELIEQAIAGQAEGRVMIDNDLWVYFDGHGVQYEIDPTEPGLLAMLTAFGIKWDYV